MTLRMACSFKKESTEHQKLQAELDKGNEAIKEFEHRDVRFQEELKQLKHKLHKLADKQTKDQRKSEVRYSNCQSQTNFLQQVEAGEHGQAPKVWCMHWLRIPFLLITGKPAMLPRHICQMGLQKANGFLRAADPKDRRYAIFPELLSGVTWCS